MEECLNLIKVTEKIHRLIFNKIHNLIKEKDLSINSYQYTLLNDLSNEIIEKKVTDIVKELDYVADILMFNISSLRNKGLIKVNGDDSNIKKMSIVITKEGLDMLSLLSKAINEELDNEKIKIFNREGLKVINLLS